VIKIQTITTIELSNICDLSCKYCINRKIKNTSNRISKIMDDWTFDRSCKLLEKLCKQGTQREINLNGNGESLLDPKLSQRIDIVKEIVGNRRVAFCTNGVSLTEGKARELAKSKIDQIDISVHSPWHARRAAHIFYEACAHAQITFGVIIASHNWAGQLEPENSIKCILTNECLPMIEGRGYIGAEGDVVPCCYDYRLLGKIGTVFDGDILDREYGPFELCKACHQVIPRNIWARIEKEKEKQWKK
jgi:hypothetical protein